MAGRSEARSECRMEEVSGEGRTVEVDLQEHVTVKGR